MLPHRCVTKADSQGVEVRSNLLRHQTSATTGYVPSSMKVARTASGAGVGAGGAALGAGWAGRAGELGEHGRSRGARTA